jgi:uncharacterized MAPEG superfamily protein
MILAYWMVLVAALMPYVTVAFAKAGADGDNHAPRLHAERLTGARRRAEWAHRNHFEAFAPFAAAVIIAGMAGVSHTVMNALASGFVAARILYTFAYLNDRATLRSLLFVVGLLCVVGLFVAAGIA